MQVNLTKCLSTNDDDVLFSHPTVIAVKPHFGILSFPYLMQYLDYVRLLMSSSWIRFIRVTMLD